MTLENRKQKTENGFTLIETMVAVTILTLAIAGPLVTANRAIVAAQSSRDQLTASYLAQEGVEYMRAMRDNDYLSAYQAGGQDISTMAWNNFLSSVSLCNATSNSAVACTYDPSNSLAPLATCSVNSCAPLNLTSLVGGALGYTQQSGGTAPRFTRTIQIVDASPNGATDVQIVSKVSWDFHGTPHSVSVSDHLTPWQ